MEKGITKDLSTCFVFIDLEKSFDNIPLSKYFETSDTSGFSNAYVTATYNIYRSTEALVIIEKTTTEPFRVTKAQKPGCSLHLIKNMCWKAINTWGKKCKSMEI